MAKAFKVANYEPNKAMVVDALNLAFRWFHSKQQDFVEDYIATVKSLRRSFECGMVFITTDSRGSTYRKSIYPEYKANRAEKYEQQSPEEEKRFMEFMAEFRRTISTIENECPEFQVIQYDGVEADDLAARLTRYRKKYGIDKLMLVSSDRDWDLLLVDEHISRFSYVSQKIINLENWHEFYEHTQEQHISVKCLQGDSGDNVPGIYKVGPATALKLLKQFGTAMDVADAIPIAGKYKYIEYTNNFGSDAIYRNYMLMDLLAFCDEAIGAENIIDFDDKVTSYVSTLAS